MKELFESNLMVMGYGDENKDDHKQSANNEVRYRRKRVFEYLLIYNFVSE